MAIATFNSQIPSEVKSGGTGKTIAILAIVAAGIYIGYKYWYLPKLEKEKENQK